MKLSEEEIDWIVIADANDDSAWEKPIRMHKSNYSAVLLPDELPITSDPEILSGETVFRGTRVPVAALLDNIEAGLTLEEFLENFPTVIREQAIQVLEFSKHKGKRVK